MREEVERARNHPYWLRCCCCARAAPAALVAPRARVLQVLLANCGPFAGWCKQHKLQAAAPLTHRAAARSLPATVCRRNAQTRALSHPLPVLRAREIDRWAHSQQYQALVAANLPHNNGSRGSAAGSAAQARAAAR